MPNVYTTNNFTHMYPQVKKFKDKNAFQQDAYCLFQWSPLDISTRGLYLLWDVPFRVVIPSGCVPGIPTPRRDLGPGIHTLHMGSGTKHTPPRRDLGPGIHTPCGQTHACENITFPQLRWRVVKKLAPTGWYFGMSHLLNTSTVNPDHSDLCNEVCR